MFASVAVSIGLGDEDLIKMGAWATFAQVWALLTLGWLAFTRPLDARTSQLFGAVGSGLAVLVGIIGLSTGLGDDYIDYSHGASWLNMGIGFSFPGVGALLGHSSS